MLAYLECRPGQLFKIPRGLRFAGRWARVRNVGLSHADIELVSGGKSVSFCIASLYDVGIVVKS